MAVLRTPAARVSGGNRARAATQPRARAIAPIRNPLSLPCGVSLRISSQAASPPSQIRRSLEAKLLKAPVLPLRRYLEHRMLRVAGFLVVVVVMAAPAYRNLGQYSDFYDGGVYLESARMAAAGYAPYREIFVSQPPVWLELIRCSFTVFGQNVCAAQLLTVTALVITTVAVGTVVLDGGVWLGAGLRMHDTPVVAAGVLSGPRDHRRTARRGFCGRGVSAGNAIPIERQASVARRGSSGTRPRIAGQAV